MKKAAAIKSWLPLARGAEAGAGELPTGAAFQPEWIDFERGMRFRAGAVQVGVGTATEYEAVAVRLEARTAKPRLKL